MDVSIGWVPTDLPDRSRSYGATQPNVSSNSPV